MTPSAHLLRTLAAVAPGTRVVDLACGDGRHLVPLARLGFDVLGVAATLEPARAALAEAVGDDARQRVVAQSASVSGESADWVVLSFDGAPELGLMAEARRVLRPGGWLWVEAPSAGFGTVADAARQAGLAVADEPGGEGGATHAVYRRHGAVG